MDPQGIPIPPRKIFFNEKAIDGVASWHISSGDMPVSEEVVYFQGTYDPTDNDLAVFINGKDEIIATIHGTDGETREASLKIRYENGQISLEPIDDDVKEWAKVHCIGKGN
jgi:hypothetical protein